MSIVKVVKGLQCCTNWKSIEDCFDCPYLHSPEKCNIRLLKEALATIDELQAAKENTIKKFKEKLIATFCPDADYFGCDIHSAINEKAKELMEENNG